METLGEYLQRHRQAAGYTIEDIARITRINPHYIQALEENAFNRLPALTFTEGFLRSYARVLSLDELEVLERFRHPSQTPTKKAVVVPFTPSVSVPEEERDEPSWRDSWQEHWKKEKTVYMTVLGLFCLAVIVFLILHPLGRKTSQVPPVGEGSPVLPQTETVPGTETLTPAQQEAGPDAAVGEKGKVEGTAPQETSLLLSFTAREETWIRVVIDEGEVRSILLPAGERVEWSAQEKFLVTLGNAGGVEAVLNNRPLGHFGERGQVIRSLLITREGVSSAPGLSVNSPKDFPENRP